jgi:hypothetical protein
MNEGLESLSEHLVDNLTQINVEPPTSYVTPQKYKTD